MNWLSGNPKDLEDYGIQGLVEDLQLEEYKGKYSTPVVVKLLLLIHFIRGKTFSGLESYKQIKLVPLGRTNAY